MEWVDSQIPTPVSPPAGREGWVKYETATDITLTPALSLKGEGVWWSALTIDCTFICPCQPGGGEGVTPPVWGYGASYSAGMTMV